MTTHELSKELVEIARDLKGQLRYLDGLGIKEYTEEDRGRETEDRSSVPGPRSPVSLSEIKPMAAKKTSKPTSVQASLFGELAPSEPAPELEPELPADETLEDIRLDIGDCTRCKLHQHRTHIVYGEGNPRADLMFVGEGPGADEDATGRPFVGRAGQLLDRMIEAIGKKRSDCYIANIVKCRPPLNREPEPDEVATCEPFLYRQINVIKPRLVVALGAVAAKTLLRTTAPISQLRGRFFDFRGTKLLPTFHPAFLLRSPNKKKEAWEDLKKVRDFLAGKITE
jgi:DNA polymerase